MRIGHSPDGCLGLCGPTVMNAPLLALQDSLSCQQLSKARAARGVGLQRLDISPCGGSWTGAVLLVLDSQGWQAKGSGKLNRNKAGGWGEVWGERGNYSGCESVTCVIFQ